MRQISLEELLDDFIKRKGRSPEYFMKILNGGNMANCNECKHLKVDKGDRWTPDTYYCGLDMDEDDCEEYEYFDYLQYLEDEENRKHDAKLQGWDWREARGDYES